MRGAMSRRVAPLAALALLVCAAACASAGSGGSMPVPARDLLTRAQIDSTGRTDLYQVIESKRPLWLRLRGPDTFGEQNGVVVYHDGSQLGAVTTLSGIPVASIAYVRYFDGITANARWGRCCGQGVIYVSSRPLTDTDP